MEQKPVGKFMQELRKQKNMTQKDLADQIGVSDKTISKWENGNSMPDTSLLMPLCQALEISVNELLAGEKLPPHDYSNKAEENIIKLLSEKEQYARKSARFTITGIVLALLAIFLLLMSAEVRSWNAIVWFIDVPSVLFLALICAACVFTSKAYGKREILRIIQKTVIPASAFISLFEIVTIIGFMDDITALGPKLAVAILTPMYALIVYLILIPINNRLDKIL